MKLTYNKYNHIPLETNIGGVRIPHLLGIVLSGKASIGEQCTIMHQVTIGVDELKNNKAPVIGNNVFIGAGAIVTKSVPDGKTVVGINRIIEQSNG
jgi:acetyltransferase